MYFPIENNSKQILSLCAYIVSQRNVELEGHLNETTK